MPTKFYHMKTLLVYYFIAFVNNFVNVYCLNSDIDNSLIGVPEIDCYADTIEMRFKTKRKFEGKIYVQGHYANPDCRVDYSKTTTEGSPIGGIRLQHGSCDMDRQRMVQPEGMQFSTVLVISFHPLFVTKADRAFHINCMYREAIKDVTAGLTVESITPQDIEYDMPMPQCTYTIRKDELNGPILKYARVGDQVVHVWECLSDTYGMLVHTCFAEDGQGEKRLVIDERGCHTDHQVLGDPTYTKDLNLAYRESYVFKFADRVGMRFSCEIKLCVKDAGGCNNITPPNCGSDYQTDNFLNNDDRENEEETNTQENLQHDKADSENATQKPEEVSLNLSTSTEESTTASLTILSPSKLHNKLKNEVKNPQDPPIKKRRALSSFPDSDQLVTPKSTTFSQNTANKTVSADLISQYVYVLDAEEEEQNSNARKNDALLEDLAPLKPRRFSSQFAANTPVCLSQGMFVGIVCGVAGLFACAAVLLFHLLLKHQLRSKTTMQIQRPPQINPSSFLFK